MKDYKEERTMMLLGFLQNVAVIIAACVITLGLFYMSLSWYSAIGMLTLLFLSSQNFLRD